MDLKDWAKIRLLALDFDGVVTDGTVVVGTDKVESVVCSHADGQGIETVRKNGIPVVVISSQRSSYVDVRCEKMGVDFFRGEKDKPGRLRNYLAEKHPSISLEQVCFVGDDRSDLAVMKVVGLPAAVANATSTEKYRSYIGQTDAHYRDWRTDQTGNSQDGGRNGVSLGPSWPHHSHQ